MPDPSGPRVTYGCESLNMVLGAKSGPSTRAVHSLNL